MINEFEKKKCSMRLQSRQEALGWRKERQMNLFFRIAACQLLGT